MRTEGCPCHGTGDLHAGHTLFCWHLQQVEVQTVSHHGWAQ